MEQLENLSEYLEIFGTTLSLWLIIGFVFVSIWSNTKCELPKNMKLIEFIIFIAAFAIVIFIYNL